jgi:hypothetical protein
MVSFKMGMNGVASLCIVVTASPRSWVQLRQESNQGEKDRPTASIVRLGLGLETFAPTLTASQASASLSGMGRAIAFADPSVSELSAFGTNADVVDSRDGPEGSSLLQLE